MSTDLVRLVVRLRNESKDDVDFFLVCYNFYYFFLGNYYALLHEMLFVYLLLFLPVVFSFFVSKEYLFVNLIN